MISKNKHCGMGILRSTLLGALTWAVLLSVGYHPEIATGMGIMMTFLSESTQHHAEVRRVQKQNRGLSHQLHGANVQISSLQNELATQHHELNTAIEELNRRDAVGSPAARELLKRQEEAMSATARILEDRDDRNNLVLKSMQELLDYQAQQTQKLQQTLADVLERVALQARGTITMQDSVMVNEPSGSNNGKSKNLQRIQELREWLAMETATSL
jgi:hypothetical protein